MNLDIFVVGYMAKKELAMTLASIALWSQPGYRLTVHDNTAVNYPLTWLWNRFIEQSNREAVALLNADVIVGPGWDYEAMHCLVGHSSVAAAMPLSNQGAHAPHYEVPDPRPDWMERMPSIVEDVKKKFPQRWICNQDRTLVSGHCMVIKKAAWQALGGFDERWPFANNDFDFNQRAINKGMHLGLCLNSAAFHMWGSSTRDAKAAGMLKPGVEMFNPPPPGASFRSI